MEGRIVTHEKTGAKAWWDGKSLTPIRTEGQIADADIAAGASGKTAPMDPSMAANLPPPPTPLIPPEAAQLGAERAGQEATEFHKAATKNIAVPAAQAALGVATGGMSIPAQMLISGGAELGAQSLGLADKSPMQVGLAAALPAVGRLITSLGKSGIQSAGQMFAPGALREAATEVVAKKGGMAADVVERAFEPKLSGKLYDLARSAGSMPTRGLKVAIDDAIKAENAMGNPERKSLRTLSGLSRKFASNPSTTFDDVINEIQRLEKEAGALLKGQRSNPTAAKNLSDTADAIAEELSRVNPAYKAAVNRYLRERTTAKIVDAIRDGNAASKLNKLIDAESARVSKAFSKDEINDIRKVASQVAEAVGSGGEGFANRSFNAMTKPISEMFESKVGRKLLGNVLGETSKTGKRTGAAMAAALQFWRAYQAQEDNIAPPTTLFRKNLE